MTNRNLLFWLIALLGIIFIMVGFFAYRDTEAPSSEQKTPTTKEPRTVGVIQFLKFLDPYYEGLKEGLAERGYIEGENITYEYRMTSLAPGSELPSPEEAARELINKENVDVLYTITSVTPRVVPVTRERENPTPVVFSGVANPPQYNFVDSYRSSGSNVTGISNNHSKYVEKNLEFLARIDPSVKTLGIFTDGFAVPGPAKRATAVLEELASLYGFEIREYTTDLAPAEVAERGFAEVAQNISEGEIDAIFHLPGHFHSIMDEIEFAHQRDIFQVPTNRYEVNGGAHFAFNADYFEVGKNQGAAMVEKIFEGINPSNIPIERPNNPKLFVNFKAFEETNKQFPEELKPLIGESFTEFVVPVAHGHEE